MKPVFLSAELALLRLLVVAALTAGVLTPGIVRAGGPLAQRCGTAALVGQERSAAAAARPVGYPNVTGSVHFAVHYSDTTDTSYVRLVSDAAELAWRVLIDTLLHFAPPSDGAAGGDNRIDIYVRSDSDIGGVWGVTKAESWISFPYPNTYTAWFEVVDTMGTPRAQTVTAHEFYHVIQMGYDLLENPSFLEMLSTWAEERVFDANNVYYEVLPAFFNEPSKALWGHTYSNVPYGIYLTEKYGDGIFDNILHQCGIVEDNNFIPAHDIVLPLFGGTTFLDEIPEFTIWNYFTGARDDGAHYPEGAAWPQIAVEKRSDCMPFPTYKTQHKYGTYASNYFLFDGNGQTDTLRVRVNPEYFNTSKITVTRFKGGAVTTETRVYPTFTLEDSLSLADWAECDSLLLIIHKQSGSEAISDTWIAAYYPRSAPPTEAYVLVLDRDDCRRPFDGIGDELTPRDGQEQAWSRGFAARGVRALQTDSIPGDLSLCAGVVIVGGYDATGVNLSDTELVQLMTFMDGGGHVYLEGRRFGEWADPALGNGSPLDETFWGYFGATFTRGAAMSAGNVSSWSTDGNGPLGLHTFAYDAFDAPDDSVGALTPTLADTLAVDQGGAVRMTHYQSPVGSRRILSTILLGGATGVGGSTREGFVASLIDLWSTIVPALSVVQMHTRMDGTRVTLEGEISGFDGEPLTFVRVQGHAMTPVATLVEARLPARLGSAAVRADDDPGSGKVEYRLYVLDQGAPSRLLWQGSVTAGAGLRPLALANLFPNPSGGAASVSLESDRDREVEIAIYDVAGRRLWSRRQPVRTGLSTIALGAPGALFPVGVYFVRIQDGAFRAQRKLMILR